MQISLENNPQLQAALLHRLKLEYAEVSAANFALDIIAGQLAQDKDALEQRVADLGAANTRMHEEIRALRDAAKEA